MPSQYWSQRLWSSSKKRPMHPHWMTIINLSINWMINFSISWEFDFSVSVLIQHIPITCSWWQIHIMLSSYQTGEAFCSALLSRPAIVLPTWYLKTIMARLVISSRVSTCWSIFNPSFVCKQNTAVFSSSRNDHRRKQQLLATGSYSFNVTKMRQLGRLSVCSAESHCTIFTVLEFFGKHRCQ